MAITITYQPNESISFEGTLLLWGADRQRVRTLLNDKFEIGDNVVDLSQYNDGDTSQNIIQRRDIYKNYKGEDNFFFLNFDSNHQLAEVELHHGFNINIDNVSIDFSMSIEKIVELLDRISKDKQQLSDGEYFYRELKLTVSTREAMGGDGNKLSYFYCSKNVTHLIDNQVCS